MNTFSYHKGWIYRALQIYVDPPHIPLIKSKLDTNLEKYSFKIKLCRNATPQKSDVYEFIMSIVDNGYPEDFLILKKLQYDAQIVGNSDSRCKHQYLRTSLWGKGLREFETIFDHIRNTTTTPLNQILLVYICTLSY